jgi:hypothetical protein
MTSMLRGLLPVVATWTLLALPAAAGVFDCPGDCNADREVTVDEIVTAVTLALGELNVDACRNADTSGDLQVTVDELLAAVTAALEGCPDAELLAGDIAFIPESFDAGGSRSLLFRLGDELVFNDGSDTPVKALHLPTRRVRPLVRKMGVPAGLAVAGDDLFWTERRNGFAPSGCVGQGVIGVVNRTSVSRRTTETLTLGDACGDVTGDVVVASGGVYYLASTVSPEVYEIRRVAETGGGVATIHSTSRRVVRLARDATHLYWMESGMGPEADTAIWRRPLAGGAIERVAGGMGMLIQFQGGFTVAGGFVYFARPVREAGWDLVRVPAAGGAEAVLAGLDAAPVGYAVVGDRLFWADAAAVRAVPVAGGAVELIADGQSSVVALAALADGVAWTEGLCCAHGQGGRVKRLRSDGTVAVLVDGIDDPGAIAGAGDRIFWAEGGPIGLIEGFGRIASMPAAGGEAETLAAGCSVTLPDMTTNGEEVFFVDRFRIKRVDRSGGLPETLVADDFFVGSIAADAGRVYWVMQPFGNLATAPITGGPTTVLATATSLAEGLRVTATHLYWGDGLTAIRRVGLGGGTPGTVADDIAALSDFVVVGDSIYFSEQDAGRITRRPLAGGPSQTFGISMPFSWIFLAAGPERLYWIDQVVLSAASLAGGSQEFLAAELASDAAFANGIFADDEAVYWSETAGGTIRMLPR